MPSPGRLNTVITPWCDDTMQCTIDKSSPVPWPTALGLARDGLKGKDVGWSPVTLKRPSEIGHSPHREN